MDYMRFILNTLLDKFEESKHFTGAAKINRKIALNFDKKEFPDYNIENFELKNIVHSDVYQLQKKDIIKIEWIPFEKNNIIKRVILNIDKTTEGYMEINRIPKSFLLQDAKTCLTEFLNEIRTSWIQEFVKFNIEYIENKNKLSRYFPEDKNMLGYLLETLKYIDKKDEKEEILERVFSKKYLGNSKRFEKIIRSRLITILRNFFYKDEYIDDNEVLSQIGLIKSSEEILFCGPLKTRLGDAFIDYSSFIFGASVNSETIKKLQIDSLNVKKVVTIENKASYLEYIKNKPIQEELVVYLAGFYSPVKRLFLKKIYEALNSGNEKIEYYHWGDIDIGGFRIFMHLREEIINELIPLYMDTDTLDKYSCEGEKFSKPYAEKLKGLLLLSTYNIFHDVIIMMLDKNIRLEQEALL
jgi:hypothetical protein